MGSGAAVANQVVDGVAMLRAAVDVLLTADLELLAGPDVAALLCDLETERRRLEAVDHRVVAQVGDRQLAGDYARTSPADLLVSLLRVSQGEARARVESARDLGPKRVPTTGELLDPSFPLVAAAQQAGAISAAHAREVIGCVDQLPDPVAAAAGPVVEQTLVDAARHYDPGYVARLGRYLLLRIDQDGPAPDDRERQRRRDLTLFRRPDGSGIVKGELTAECLAVWQAVLDALAAPAPADRDTEADGQGEPDDRSPGQRRHDALLDAGQRVLRSATLPESGGVPVSVVLTMTEQDLTRGHGSATTAHGDLVSVPDAIRIADEANVTTVVLTATGGILSYGTSQRIASPGQRRALTARDGGCTFPGCTRPPAWCQAHHITRWTDGGPTDIDNLTLICGYHHREFERRGWTVRIRDRVPEWIPPRWLDPEQRPQRNMALRVDPDFRIPA